MRIKAIKTEKEYEIVLKQIENLMNCKKGSKEEELLEVLSILVEDYERINYPVLPVNAVEAVKYYLEENNLRQSDIAIYFGGKARVSEFLAGKRRLSLKVIRNLYQNLDIPVESLIMG